MVAAATLLVVAACSTGPREPAGSPDDPNAAAAIQTDKLKDSMLKTGEWSRAFRKTISALVSEGAYTNPDEILKLAREVVKDSERTLRHSLGSAGYTSDMIDDYIKKHVEMMRTFVESDLRRRKSAK
jgi:hypothetical protein